MIEVLERFSRGKASEGGYTEDRLIETPHHCGVLDGSRGPGYPGAEVVTAILDRAVDDIAALPPDIDLPALVERLNAIASEEKTRAGIVDFRATGGFVFCLYSAAHQQVWRVGDCKFRMAGRTHDRLWPAEETSARARALILRAWQLDGASAKDIMARPDYDGIINTMLAHQAQFLNRADHPLSFGAIMGLPVPLGHLERHPSEAGELVITSDGYPVLADTLAETEAALADLLARDPLCIQDNLQCKGLGLGRVSFDDRAFLRVRVGG